MDIFRVSFAGHRNIYGQCDLEDRIQKIAEEIICNNDFVEFYVGRNGDFDISAASAIKRSQKSFDYKTSSLILVQPYRMKDDEFYEDYYDEIIYPIDVKTHCKSAIVKRNKWMVDHSNMLIAFVTEESGGAYTTLKYAEKAGIETVNFASEEDDEETSFDTIDFCDTYSSDDIYISDEEMRYENSKTNALIYLRAHYDEISKNEWYAKAYRIMLDEMIRSHHKAIYRDIITKISDEDREMKNRALDMLIETEGKENTENFKDDARFAVEFLKSIYSN